MARGRIGALALAVIVVLQAPLRAGDVAAARAELYAGYSRQLGQLADECDRQSQGDAAKILRTWLPPREAGKLTLFLLPPRGSLAEPPELADTDLQARFRTLRTKQAETLFAVGKRAAAEGQLSAAYELAVETVRENPDHPQARQVLGYVRTKDGWRTPFEVKQAGANKVWHEQFGWLAKAQVAHYERGERLFRGRWILAAEDAALHADIRQGWRVESDHYVVTTNHSLEEGVRLAERLETLYSIWQQVFVGYQLGESELTRRFDGRVARRDTKPHNVVYYRSRDEYNRALRAQQPQIEITLGIYFGDSHTAYFFADEEQHAGTLYHEATHQLFQETRPVSPRLGRTDNFWIIEAIACYMESLELHGSYATLGGRTAGRVPAARQRLHDGFYVPLAELTRLGMEGLQNDPRIVQLYSQSAGLADFLMHGDGGKYREPLVQFLTAVYEGKATAQSLAQQTGVDYPTLDRQYREFME